MLLSHSPLCLTRKKTARKHAILAPEFHATIISPRFIYGFTRWTKRKRTTRCLHWLRTDQITSNRILKFTVIISDQTFFLRAEDSKHLMTGPEARWNSKVCFMFPEISSRDTLRSGRVAPGYWVVQGCSRDVRLADFLSREKWILEIIPCDSWPEGFAWPVGYLNYLRTFAPIATAHL